MVGHKDVTQYSHLVSFRHFVKEMLEVLIILIVEKYLCTAVGTVDDVIYIIT